MPTTRALKSDAPCVGGPCSSPAPRPDPGPEMVEDELGAVVAAVCARFPDHALAEVADLVSQSYRHLQVGATVTAHLIPLTLNRSLRLMRESTGPTRHGTDADAAECSPLDRRTG
jgi:hypothetical protein